MYMKPYGNGNDATLNPLLIRSVPNVFAGQFPHHDERGGLSVKTLFRAILSASRKRRGAAVGASLWLLRVVRDIEEEEIHRVAREMRAYDWESDSSSPDGYEALEEEDTRCDCALGFIECAIDDLDYAYWGAYGNGKEC